MNLQTQQLTNGVTKINLTGRMDSAGIQGVDLQFAALTATKKAEIVIDLSAVSFLTSIGIRTLIINARAQQQRGGKMILLSPQPLVDEVLKSAGVTTVIETFYDLQSACEALGASPESI